MLAGCSELDTEFCRLETICFCHSVGLPELKLHAYLSFLQMLFYPLPSIPMQKINLNIVPGIHYLIALYC